jgi:hypothetical protein
MAGKLTVVGAGLGLDGSLGRSTVASRTLYLALLVAAPNVSSTPSSMSEYVATGYGRQACAMGVPSGTPRVAANTALLTYGPLTGANGLTTITHWALVSSSSGTTGEMVAFGDFNTTRTPASGDSATVSIGAITVGID